MWRWPEIPSEPCPSAASRCEASNASALVRARLCLLFARRPDGRRFTDEEITGTEATSDTAHFDGQAEALPRATLYLNSKCIRLADCRPGTRNGCWGLWALKWARSPAMHVDAREQARKCLLEAAASKSAHNRAVLFAMAQVWLKVASRAEGREVTPQDVLQSASLNVQFKQPRYYQSTLH